MTGRKNIRKTILWSALAVLCAVLFLFGLFISSPVKTESADALTSSTLSSATKVANGTDMWNSSTSTLNQTVVSDLKSKLFGTENPTTYIKNNADANELKWGSGYVVPATTINKKANNTSYGLVLKLGGLDWIVTSLTISSTNRVVVTLYLADDTNTRMAMLTGGSNSKGCNMYSSSQLRKYIKTNSTYSLFADTSSFATQYLIQPNNIQYQHTQSAINRGINTYNMGNEALDDVSGAWSSAVYKRGDTYNGTSGGGLNAKYEDWGNDYIWLPSFTETGDSKHSNSIWKLTVQQRAHSYTYCHLRSAYPNSYTNHCLLNTSGEESNFGYNSPVTSTYSIRPAIHFNLDAAGITIPQNVEKVYTGEGLAFTDQSWYDSTMHGNASIMTSSITFNGTTTLAMRNVGEYTVTFHIVTTNQDIAWADGTREDKSFKFKITQKPITLTASTEGGGVSFKIDAGQIAKDDPPPEIGLRYFDSTGQTELEAPPNRKGVYIAEAVLLNADSSNYKLAATYRQTFEIFSTPIPVPSTEKTSFEYTGSEIEFKLTNFDAALIFDPEIKTDGMRMTTGADGAVSLFAKDVKRYEIQFRLRDTGNYCWDTGGTGTASLFLEITGKPLTLTFARENNNWQWDTGTNGQFTVTHDGVEGDNVALVISYVKADGTKVAASNVSVAGKTTTVTLLPLEKGNYTLVAELVKAQAGVNSNGNYVLRQEYLQPFTVVGRQATLPALKWKISVGGITSDLAAGQTFSYQGREFSVSLDTSDFPANGVDIKADSWQNNRFTVVGNYTTSVTITAYDSGWDFTDQTVQISWSVIKALYDLSNTTWNYNPDSPPVYSGAPQNISLLNLPAGLTPNYTRNYTDATSDGDTYHTRVQAFLNDDPDNYVTPVFGNADSYLGADFLWELDWVIAKKPIELSWMMTTKKDSNGRTFQYPTLAVDANRVVFTFYTESDVEIPLDNIAVRQGHEDGYYVIASLNEETAKNYRLNGSLTRFEFVVGRVATAVSILQITNSGTAYSARPQAATFTFTDGIALTADDFALSYFVGENAAEGEAPLDGAPTDAGKYRVRFSLQANENTKSFYIDGEDTFAYEIVKATLDVSEAKWNYENPFSYAIENGAEKVYEVRLIGLPDYLDKLATYTGAQRNSMVSTNNVTVSFANFDTKNYEPFTLPEALNASAAGGVISASLTWEIVPRELARPVYTGGKIVYDGAARNLFDLVRFPDDKETYINIAITKSGNPAFDGSNTVKDAGRYVVTCRIKDEFINNGGVVWKGGDTLAQAAVVEITPLELVATGWSNKPPRPVFANSSVKRDYYSVTYYLTEGGANEEVSEGNLTDAQYHGKTFRARVTIPDGMKNNVSLRLQGTLDTTDFIMFEPGSETSLKKPTIKVASYEYDGEEHEFEISGINVKYMIVSGSLFRTEVGVSKITITLNPKENVEWEDFEVNKYEEVVLEIEITKGKISAGEADWNTDDMPPTLYLEGDKINAVEYTYQTQSGAPVAADKLKPNTKYYVIANIKEEYLDKYGFDAGSYLSEASEGYLFTYILYVELPTLKTATFVYDGSAHEITADSFEGFEDKYLEIKGTLTFRDAGEYDIVFSIKEGTGAVWKKSGNADDQTVRLTITKAIVVVTWDNYSYRTPKAILDGFPANAFVYEYIDALTGSVVPSTALVDGANYQTRIRLSDKYALNYMFEETQSAVSDAQFFTLSGNRPIDPSNPIVPGEGDNPSDKTIEPLPQIILSGIGIVLTVVFAIMTINYASVVKSATEKRKKLAQMTYSFAPTGLLALLFGFSESNWWIVAGVSLGAALITAIVMFMFRKKSKKALALLEEEKERVEAEKEYAKEERTRMDQQRRDEEMRMMFAAMQQQNAQQPQMQYNDMRAMLAETVSALLPAIQQVQALPPAADPSQYGDPYAAQQPYGAPQQPYAAPQQPYAMPQQPYGAPQQPYGAPQQPYAAPAPDPNETEALRAQIAQQQEMLNRILQNQQAQQTQQAEPKPVYADSYAAGEDLSWLGESSETVSLEELYGNLSDEGKRCYYEIGSYIMGKPQTSQNDGKYAVLFKYRGKTLFKLCILNNAPVLYYLSDYGARAELFITDIHVLETAKAIVDHLYERTDRELG